ncbi:MAG TPA: metal-dependent transcriptional regulator [Candidatus Omnitrophica bacterium]|nr:MAG: metal-dependent transcriptional regulator [Candidatus Omnitrophota bacterium]RKY34126.1 MAG: metal-dependent transcriptional regulator [Candidatus Omnitrophota bacterium]RKY41906.1 MAG: metal-dependent transcriptional regulator [Candidatus Omnitrophota bacterium]HEC69239.1 metal-dependent transcriptional regulator [Candidatus Omnitrophota bacterium]
MVRKVLTPNMEDYLEAIGSLSKVKKVVRVKDVAKKLGVKTSSVNNALARLSKGGLITHERYGYVELTPQGKALAREIEARHNTLIKFLREVLKISPQTAKEDACKMEHSISKQTFQKLKELVESLENNKK